MNKPKLIFILFLSIFWTFIAHASPESKPFAEERIVLQLSDNDPTKQTLVLNVANNLIKHYGPDKVDIEIVTFGPGLRLLFKENSNHSRIDGLSNQGVTFAACQNTLKKMTSLLGYEPALSTHATPVGAGVVRIIELEGSGYKLIKP